MAKKPLYHFTSDEETTACGLNIFPPDDERGPSLYIKDHYPEVTCAACKIHLYPHNFKTWDRRVHPVPNSRF